MSRMMHDTEKRAPASEIAVTIEPMQVIDLASVAAIEAASANPAWTEAMFESELRHNHFASFWVARGVAPSRASEGRGQPLVVGYIGCWIIFEELHLLNVVTHPDWRRRGVASRLIRQALGSASALGAARALLEVRDSNEPAQALYRGFGFEIVARRSGYYSQPKEDALIMARDIAPEDEACAGSL